jgi:hypothetical protein
MKIVQEVAETLEGVVTVDRTAAAAMAIGGVGTITPRVAGATMIAGAVVPSTVGATTDAVMIGFPEDVRPPTMAALFPQTPLPPVIGFPSSILRSH